MVEKKQLEELRAKADQIAEIVDSADPQWVHLLWEMVWADYCQHCGRKYKKRCCCTLDD